MRNGYQETRYFRTQAKHLRKSSHKLKLFSDFITNYLKKILT